LLHIGDCDLKLHAPVNTTPYSYYNY